MEIGGVNFNSLATGNEAVQNMNRHRESAKFDELVKKMQNEASRFESMRNSANLSSEQILDGTHLNGDYRSGFGGTYKAESDKNSLPRGAAANQSGSLANAERKIDRTSKLYEQAMELESYFVKIMLSSMKNTIQKSELFKSDYASEMYDDMLYDEYAVALTKNAGFGLADQIYLQLNRVNLEA